MRLQNRGDRQRIILLDFDIKFRSSPAQAQRADDLEYAWFGFQNERADAGEPRRIRVSVCFSGSSKIVSSMSSMVKHADRFAMLVHDDRNFAILGLHFLKDRWRASQTKAHK